MERVKLEIVADYVCPFCWLAKPAVRQLALEDPKVDLVWRAFELRPDPVPSLDPGGDYLKRVWRDSVYPLAEKMEMPLKLPPVQARWRRAHEAARWAREMGRFDAYSEGLFRAFFERGEDIGQVDVLVGVARAAGLDGAPLAAALKRRDYELAVMTDESEARRLQISSVPSFVAGGVAM